jgi:hypothetical protein
VAQTGSTLVCVSSHVKPHTGHAAGAAGGCRAVVPPSAPPCAHPPNRSHPLPKQHAQTQPPHTSDQNPRPLLPPLLHSLLLPPLLLLLLSFAHLVQVTLHSAFLCALLPASLHTSTASLHETLKQCHVCCCCCCCVRWSTWCRCTSHSAVLCAPAWPAPRPPLSNTHRHCQPMGRALPGFCAPRGFKGQPGACSISSSNSSRGGWRLQQQQQ